MFQIKAEILIKRPIEEVFAFIADNENDPQWCVPVETTDRITGDTPGPATRYVFSSKAGLMKLRGEFQIVDFEPPHRITWEGQSSVNRFRGQYLLQKVEEGTLLAETASFTPKGFLRTFESSMRKEVEASVFKQLQNLKRLLEA